MTVKAQQVYNIALVLVDDVVETGTIQPSEPEYTKTKALSILTTLQAELLDSSQTPVSVTDLNQVLLLPDRLCLTALPYGLAAHLIIQDDPNSAAFFNGRYEELKARQPAVVGQITDKYSVLDGMN